ncbi:TlpA disulfide reductase family protein [Neptunitalea chrysea]|nr:TlpA disulfide reductase family protein [Neptunitalea chrysea]
MMQKIIFYFILTVLLIGIVSCDSSSKENDKTEETSHQVIQTNTKTKPKENVVYTVGEKKVPQMDFSELERKVLSQSNNKTYVVNFWATWCAPCVKELPHFEALNAKYKDKNVEVILVSLDFPDKVDTQLVPFIRKKDLQSKVIFLNDSNMNEWIPKVSKNWSGAIPATLIYNKENRTFYEQSFTFEELESALTKTLIL